MSGDYGERLQQALRRSIAAKEEMLNRQDQLAVFAAATTALVAAYRAGGRLYIAGNGGSAADAQHLAAEFVSRLAKERPPLAAEALTVDSSILTAIGNDYGYETLFSRQVAGKMRAGDVFLGITTSGNSPNILLALETCRSMGFKSIVFTGHQGGGCQELADYCILATGESTATIQEVHIVLAHTLCACVEAALFPD